MYSLQADCEAAYSGTDPEWASFMARANDKNELTFLGKLNKLIPTSISYRRVRS